jgi:hypothetical protein
VLVRTEELLLEPCPPLTVLPLAPLAVALRLPLKFIVLRLQLRFLALDGGQSLPHKGIFLEEERVLVVELEKRRIKDVIALQGEGVANGPHQARLFALMTFLAHII